MLGRARRARGRVAEALGEPVRQGAVFAVHDPRLLAAVLATGLGAASVGAGSPATGIVLSEVVDWGEREAQLYARLPHKVLLAVTPKAAHVLRWPVGADATPLITLCPGDFTAHVARHRWYGQVELRIILPSHKVVLLFATAGLLRGRSAAACAQAAADVARESPGEQR